MIVISWTELAPHLSFFFPVLGKDANSCMSILEIENSSFKINVTEDLVPHLLNYLCTLRERNSDF